MSVKCNGTHVIYENPLPQLRSRHSGFPWICEMKDGSLLATHVLSEAFESVDGNTRLSVSKDGGKSFTLLPPVYTPAMKGRPASDSLKPTLLPDGRLILFGYEFFRDDPELPLANPETGGLLSDRLLLLTSVNEGASFTVTCELPCSWGPHVEASAPITVLQNGDWVTPIAGFPRWDGSLSSPVCGRLLRSCDEGKTWNDDTVIMRFPGDVTAYEQRICQLASGKIVAIAWNEDMKTGERLNNHWAFSDDKGKTFTGPLDTGVLGQASSVCAIGGERLLALHAIRRDTDRPGIYGYTVDLSKGRWDRECDPVLLWEPATPVRRDKGMAEIFAFLKFGQPGAVRLSDGRVLMTHWAAEDGQYRTFCSELQV